MLPFLNRLKKEDFKLLKNFKKKFFVSDNINLKLYYSGFNPSRFSVVVPTSFSKKATKRNKIKRQTKAALLNYLKKIEPGFASVFYFKKETKNLSFEEIKKEILFLLKKSKIL
ncbi:ribonuclease P protein component [Patescibacteria group bacterium]|nr:ribonuclease P protein component [Patescibacteria group bacterium]